MLVGIEIGGTKLQVGVGEGAAPRFQAFHREAVDPQRGAQGIRDAIIESVRGLQRRFPIERIGIGFGGPVDAARGRVIASHQVAGWTDFPIVDWCRNLLGVPAVLGNDCDCAALAEAKFGAGRGRRIVLYVTVGTGIGGGLVVDGRVQGAFRPAATEIGHLRPGLECETPVQTVESIASGRGIEAAARRWLSEVGLGGCAAGQSCEQLPPDAADLMRRAGDDPNRLTARDISDAAVHGNAAARRVLSNAVRTLGWAIAQATTLTAPEIVIVGGGVSLMPESLFLAPLKAAIHRYLFPPLQETLEVVSPVLGEEVVVHGAVALAVSASP